MHRRVDVLNAVAAEAPAALPLLATQMTQSVRITRITRVGPDATAADRRRLARGDTQREADEALLALLPAACHIAAAVAADQPLTRSCHNLACKHSMAQNMYRVCWSVDPDLDQDQNRLLHMNAMAALLVTATLDAIE